MIIFRDRFDAGEQLASKLLHLRGERPVVLALPRGGVPVAERVARMLGAPLDVLVSAKLGAPGQPELGFGAVAEGEAVYVDPDSVRLLALPIHEVEVEVARAHAKVLRRVQRYRGTRPLPDLEGRTVILVDDGVATGGTAHAAIRAVREQAPGRLVFAAPVISASTARELSEEVDELVCVEKPQNLWAIGAWYEDFRQLSDAEVLEPLRRSSGSEVEPAPI